MKANGASLRCMTLLLYLGTIGSECFVILSPSPRVTLLEGSNLTFSCAPLYSIALPIVERNSIVLFDQRLSHIDHELDSLNGYRAYTLVNVSTSDSHSVWRCYIGGLVSNTLTITVHSKSLLHCIHCIIISSVPPSSPYNVTVPVVTSTWMTLQWRPPLTNGSLPLTNYKVILTTTCSNTSRTMLSRSSGANITNLIPGLTYNITIIACANNYSSQPSSSVTIATKPSGDLLFHCLSISMVTPNRWSIV